MQRDKDEVADLEACIAEASRPELIAFCQMLQRARKVELSLMRNQLCLLREDCRLPGSQDEAAASIPKAKRRAGPPFGMALCPP
jgi:hypothetical protein